MSTFAPKRIASIDLFRALTMITMLFVNDFAGMQNIPHWLHHAAGREDMMGFSDLVFPAFLFCVGLSVPFAINARKAKGDSIFKIILHVVLRTVALLVMGLYAMNDSGVEGGLSYAWLSIIAIPAFFLIWNEYPKAEGFKKWLFIGLRVLGVAMLAFLVCHRISHGSPIRTGWWGILGLIGWAYLFSTIIYLLTCSRKWLVWAAWAAVILIEVLNFSGVSILKSLPGGWTDLGLSMTGVATSVLMIALQEKENDKKYPVYLLIASAVMLVAAVLSHQKWIISKIGATPTWMFFSLHASLLFLALFYWLVDIKGWNVLKTGFGKLFLLPAGAATLTCYVLPEFTWPLRIVTGFHYPEALGIGFPGLCKALALAFIMSFIAGMLSRIHIKLKI